MNRTEQAIEFVTKAHSGQIRKLDQKLYIFHPFECAIILNTLTDDEDTIIAGLLHDSIEDSDTTLEQVEELFGKRVAYLVKMETEDKRKGTNKESTWEQRKKESLEELAACTDLEVKKIWLADKLSNTRSMYRVYLKEGDETFNHFNQKDKSRHKWLYYYIAELLNDLKDTLAYQEYMDLLQKIFD